MMNIVHRDIGNLSHVNTSSVTHLYTHCTRLWSAVSWSYYYTPSSVTYTLEVLISTLLSHTGKLLAVLTTCRSDLESGNYIQQHFKPAATSTCVTQRIGKLGFDLFDISASTILIWTICIPKQNLSVWYESTEMTALSPGKEKLQLLRNYF